MKKHSKVRQQERMPMYEKWDRYTRMRREAESEMDNFREHLSTSSETFDRMELAFCWRMSLEGVKLSEDTWQDMIEATEL